MLLYVALFSAVDIQGEFLILRGITMSTITSYSILINVSTISAMIFSILLLKIHYESTHFLGAFIAIVGVVLATIVNIPSDTQEDISAKRHFMGDLSIILGQSCIGLSN